MSDWNDVLIELHDRFDALEKELRKASAEMSAIIREYVDRPKGEWMSEGRVYPPTDEPTISKMEQVDKDINVRSKDEPRICDTCRYYNSNIPCGSTPSACKEADKFAEEFVDGLKKLKPKDEPQTDCAWR